MQRMVLIMVVATLTYSSAALAQGSSVLGGTGGLPDHNVPGTDLPLYDPDWAKAAGAELTAMREAAAKCDRAAYDLAVRRWNFANSEMLRMWEKQAGQFARRRVADAETLRRFQQNSPDFPQFPVEKCAKKAVVDPPPPPPPPPPTPDPKPPTPPGAGVPRNITVTHRGSCPPCAGIAAKFNKAAEDYAAAVSKGTLDEPLDKAEMEELGRELDACEAKQCTSPPAPSAGRFGPRPSDKSVQPPPGPVPSHVGPRPPDKGGPTPPRPHQ